MAERATVPCEIGCGVRRTQGAVMRKKTRRPTNGRDRELTHSDGDGNRIHNEILLGLSAAESRVMFPKLELVRLRPRQVLHEVGDTLKSAYFCNSGLISILSTFPDGKNVEIALVGKESFVGLPLIAGFQSAGTRAIVQLEATAFRIDASTLEGMLRQCLGLERRLQQCSQITSSQISQIAACNLLHEVKERLARWLLMCQDRTGSETMALTQELLAEMLGTRRSSVTVAAGQLQKSGLIVCRRGKVRIQNRRRLISAACECYEAMQRQARVWHNEAREAGVGA
jgi:CRP-like cAMP-binding protein